MKAKQQDAPIGLKLAWRIGLPHIETEEAFERMLELMTTNRAIVDEVALFETITHHLYIPLDVYAARMEMTSRRLDAFRLAGVPSVGINVLCTMGHLNEAWSYMPPLPFQPIVGHDGSVSKGCACPNTPEMREYIRAKYELVAKARPDFIWLDDDIRMHHKGVAWGCFCPTCMEMFARKAGRKYAREELVKAFDDPAQGALRETWVQQNIETIEALVSSVEATIHKIDPGILTGLMTAGPGWTTYSGVAFDRWYTALKAAKARPGGGFYADTTPIQMYHKAVETGWQRRLLPPAVTDIQYEVENFPYQRLKKSSTALLDECSLALAHGLNGIAFNILGLGYEDFLPLVKEIPAARPLWEKWVAHATGLPTAGLWAAWSTEVAAKRLVRPGENWLGWSSEHDIYRPLALGEIGIPITTDQPACASVLNGRLAEAFDDNQLRAMLFGGVLMDTATLDVLAERGLAHLAGVRIARRLDNGLMERFTDDAMNGSGAGQIRDARIEFWGDAKGLGDVLEPTAKGVRILARMEDYFYRDQGPCMTAFQNELGGRVAVMGYAQWIFLHSVAKRRQLQNVADWISRGEVPVRVDQAVPLVSVARLSANRRKGAVMLLNAGMDDIREATVHVRVSAKRARLLAFGQEDRAVEMRAEESGGILILRDIPPWGIRALLFGE